MVATVAMAETASMVTAVKVVMGAIANQAREGTEEMEAIALVGKVAMVVTEGMAQVVVVRGAAEAKALQVMGKTAKMDGKQNKEQ
jgi:hypothetical protein